MSNWEVSETRRDDLMRAAQRHQLAQEVAPSAPMRKRLGEWMVKTGNRLMTENKQAPRQTDWAEA